MDGMLVLQPYLQVPLLSGEYFIWRSTRQFRPRYRGHRSFRNRRRSMVRINAAIVPTSSNSSEEQHYRQVEEQHDGSIDIWHRTALSSRAIVQGTVPLPPAHPCAVCYFLLPNQR